MQAVLTSNTLSNMVDLKSKLTRLFEKLETADNVAKNSIENEIVNFGDTAVEFLIDMLTGSKGTKRGVAAMSLIRIGEASIRPLRQLSEANKNYTWVANYIIQEIEGNF